MKAKNKKVVLIVKDGCPHCEYILKQLEKLNLRDKIEIVKDNNARITPAIKIGNDIDYITGNVYGLIKLLMLLYLE